MSEPISEGQLIGLRMQRDIYENEQLLRHEAEKQIGKWRELVQWVAQWIDPSGLDELGKQRKQLWTPDEYREFFRGAWSRMDRRKLWGYPYEKALELEARVAELKEQNELLAQENQDLRQQLAAGDIQIAAKDNRIAALEQQVEGLTARRMEQVAASANAEGSGPAAEEAPNARDATAASDPVVRGPDLVSDANPLAQPTDAPDFDPGRQQWPPPLRGNYDAHILWLVGARGWSVRTRLARRHAAYVRTQGGQARSTSGSVNRRFACLDGVGQNAPQPPLLDRALVQAAGLRLVFYALSEAGQHLYRQAFGADPVESEWERLQRRHPDDSRRQHAGLVMAAAFSAEQYLTRGRTLICPPPPLEGAEPDLYVAWEGGRLFVACERLADHQAGSEATPRRWQRQVVYQGAVAVVTDSEQARLALLERIRPQVPGSTPVWATDLEYLANAYARIRDIRKRQGLDSRAIPDDGAQGATWFWADRPVGEAKGPPR